MRTCKRCNTVMVEGFGIAVQHEPNRIEITQGLGWRAKRLEKLKVAICSDCGEVSMYIEDLEPIKEMKYKDI